MGWPWCVRGVKRTDVVGVEKFVKFIKNPEILDRINKRISFAKQGKILDVVWLDCLKDELRKISKIEQGLTRAFCIAPFDFFIVMKMYFIDFLATFYARHCEFFSTIGLDPESFEWHMMTEKLLGVGNRFACMDYKDFDSSVAPDLLSFVVKTINKWYDDGPENALVREVLLESCMHRNTIVGDCFYVAHWGNPSGGLLTPVFNGVAGALYVREFYAHLYPDKNFSDFNNEVRDFNHGDDVVMTKSPLIEYDLAEYADRLSAIGVTVTPARKDSSEIEWVDLSHVDFLKRKFVRLTMRPGIVFAALEETSMLKLLHWYHKCDDLQEMWRANVRTCLRYAVTNPSFFCRLEPLLREISKREDIVYDGGSFEFIFGEVYD
jgi:hypothetical protein